MTWQKSEISSEVTQRRVMGPSIFIFITVMFCDKDFEGIIKFAKDTKLGGIANIQKTKVKIQNDLNRL